MKFGLCYLVHVDIKSSDLHFLKRIEKSISVVVSESGGTGWNQHHSCRWTGGRMEATTEQGETTKAHDSTQHPVRFDRTAQNPRSQEARGFTGKAKSR